MSEDQDHDQTRPNTHAQGQRASVPIELWDRFTEGESLASTERQLLVAALRDDIDFRQFVIDERWIDSLLKIEAEDELATAAFVGRVLQRCQPEAALIAEHGTVQTLVKPFPIGQAVAINTQPSHRYRRPSRHQRIVWWTVAAILLLSVSGIGVWYRSDPSRPAQVAMVKPDAPITSKVDIDAGVETKEPILDPTMPSQPFYAMLTRTDQIGEGVNLNVGDRFGEQAFELASGEIQLTMASGVMVELFAPVRVEFTSPNSLRLLSGELSATVPSSAQGFQVLTPSVVVTDLGTVFDIAVEESGKTEIEVRDGNVTVASRDESTQQQWHLNADQTYRLTFYAPPVHGLVNVSAPETSIRPIVSWAHHQTGETTGVISLDGRSLKFDDEVVFATVRDQLFRGIQESPQQLAGAWNQFVEATTNEPPPAGSIELNGKEFQFDNFNEAVRAQNKILAQFAPSPDLPPAAEVAQPNPPDAAGHFRGSLFIKGERRDFDSLEQYQAAMRELMGPAADFGFFPF
jgi:hypothetical protein